VAWVELEKDGGADQRALYVRPFSLDGGWLAAPARVPTRRTVQKPVLPSTADALLLGWIEERPAEAVMFSYVTPAGSTPPKQAGTLELPTGPPGWLCAVTEDGGAGHLEWSGMSPMLGALWTTGASLRDGG